MRFCTRAHDETHARIRSEVETVRNLLNANVPERVAMKISGRRTRGVFDRYHIVSLNDLVEATRKLEIRAAGTFSATPGVRE